MMEVIWCLKGVIEFFLSTDQFLLNIQPPTLFIAAATAPEAQNHVEAHSSSESSKMPQTLKLTANIPNLH